MAETHTQLRGWIIAIIAVTVVALAAALGASEKLGAHPFWAVQSCVVGAIIGGAIFLALRWAGVRSLLLLGLFSLVFLASAAAAHYGKQAFAASFAENALAGRFWYFGWFGIASGVSGMISSALTMLTSQRRT